MDTTLSPPAGQLLDGRYRVEAQLARGGMATVYLALDTRLERRVALKVARPELASDEEFVRRFSSEARSAARLSSPHVVTVYDQGSDGALHYLAMEYVAGRTLRELLTERGRLPARDALSIICGVLAGLAVAHEAGIVHRDVKPENVLITRAGLVKVADFGLARAAAAAGQTRTGMIIGTAAYLAPEQVTASVSDTRSDVYATGIMLFELLTGRQPHTADTPLAVAYKHVSEPVLAPSSLVPGLPGILDALVALATSRNPGLRPADAGHFLQAATAALRGLPRPGPHQPGLPRTPGPPPPRESTDPHGSWAAASGAAGQGGGGRAGARTEALNGVVFPAGSPAAAATGTAGPAAGDRPDRAGLAALGLGGASAAALASADATAELKPGGGSHSARTGSSHRAANHTLIVSAGDPGLGYDPQVSPGGQHGYRPPHEPVLQRWLFSRRIGYLMLAAVLVLAALLGVRSALTGGRAAVPRAAVPRLAGLTVSAARAELRGRGFAVRTGTAEYSPVPAGGVLRTVPRSGASVRRGTTVTLVSSLGPAFAQVPPVTGIAAASAEAALRQAGLSWVLAAPATSTTIGAGTVISTSPVALVRWRRSRPVSVTVSAGPPLPGFAGTAVAAAEATAQAGGYHINPVQDAAGTAAAGTIVRQSPAPGSPISPNEVVTVYVSPGPPLVAVPQVQGMPAAQAAAALQNAGFTVAVNRPLVGDTVFSYSPTGQAPQGSVITINLGISFP